MAILGVVPLLREPEETLSLPPRPSADGDTGRHAAEVPTAGATPQATEASFADWLAAELPPLPTVPRKRARAGLQIKRQHIVIGSVAAGVLLLFVLLGIVLKLRTSEGTLVVEVNQAEAEVLVDDGTVTITTKGEDPLLQVRVAEGKHKLRVKKGGFETFTKEFSVESGGQARIRVWLQRVRVASSKPTAPKPPAATPGEDLAQVLPQFPQLRFLDLRATKVTAAGIEGLRRGLPKCVIFWDGGAVIPGASAPAAPAAASPSPDSLVIGPPLPRPKPVALEILPEPKFTHKFC